MDFSIVIPFHNAELTLSDAVTSCIHQDGVSLELILIDNHSDDHSPGIALDFARSHSFITYQREERVGACIARNRGLRMAQAPWVLFLDADDVLIQNVLGKKKRFIEEQEHIEFIAGAFRAIDRKGLSKIHGVSTAPNLLVALLELNLGTTSSMLFRRNKLLEIDGWNEEYSAAQDLEIVFRLIKGNASIAVDQTISCVKRFSPMSISGHPDQEQKHFHRATLFKEALEFGLEKKLFSETDNSTYKDYLYHRLVPLFRNRPSLALDWYKKYIGKNHKLSWNNLPSWYRTYFNFLGFQKGCQLYHRFLFSIRR